MTRIAVVMGMMWVPMGDHPGANGSDGSDDDFNRLGGFLGPMSQAITDLPLARSMVASDLLTGERYGERFARIVRHWRRDGAYSTERFRDAGTTAVLRTRAAEAKATNAREALS